MDAILDAVARLLATPGVVESIVAGGGAFAGGWLGMRRRVQVLERVTQGIHQRCYGCPSPELPTLAPQLHDAPQGCPNTAA